MGEETIQIKKESVSSGSCMTCKRGTVSEDELRLVYPYEEVFALTVGYSSRLQIRFCDECLKVLKSKVDEALSATK